MFRLRPCALAALLLAASASAGAAGAPPLAPGQGVAFNAWLRVVQRRLIRSVTRSHGFPRKARVVVGFSIGRDGKAFGVHTVSSSDSDPRYPALSERVVALAGPYPPVPESHAAPVRIAVPLEFNVTPHVRHHKRHHVG